MKWNIERKDIIYKLLIDEKYWWNIKSILKPPKNYYVFTNEYEENVHYI